ncbi:hypothetical protein CVT26_006697 [Gymnopilus dilepis]|uniref:Uncharacterized protein n=1 Tax=Gymnopilus dilepis TaxID=231916 RepID=A0A409WQ95_9AGAR|nr:hypothetical protein CVT26_006697 [Gymnopilus dilepis]
MAFHDERVYQSYSIGDFYKKCKHYYGLDDTKFVKFTLCGIDEEGEFVIDPIRDALKPSESFICTRDYDSLLGFHEHIGVDSYVTVHPVSKKEHSLGTNVHLKHEFESSRGRFKESIHKVPNICLGTWGPHNHLLRIYIPELYDADHPTNLLSQAQQRTFYEKGLRPAIADILDIESLEWPATYADEFWRARGRNGQLSFTTKTIPSAAVYDLANAIRNSLRRNDVPWHFGLVVLHQIRGVKHSSSHNLDRQSAKRALSQFFAQNSLSRDALLCGTWWIDVALNITSDDGRSYAWRTDAHFHLTRKALGLSEDVAQRITSIGSSKYTRDLTSHLAAVSGWRISPGPRAEGKYSCCYFQGYTTDKALTARVDSGHHGKFTTCQDVLSGKAIQWSEDLFNLNRNACTTNSSTARMEMRVPLKHAITVFLDVDDQLIRRSIVSVNSVVWWGVRAYRTMACGLLFRWYSQGPETFRATPLALLLVAALVWLVNGLHSTPDKGANSKRLMDAVIPHISRVNADPDILAYGTPTKDDDVASDWSTDDEALMPANRRRVEGETAPGFPKGMVFLRRICCGPANPVPRFHNSASVLHPKAFKFFFKAGEDEVRQGLASDEAVRPSNPDRVRNKTKHTPLYVEVEDVEMEEAAPLLLFHLHDEGFSLLPKPSDEGEDVQGDDEFSVDDICKDNIDEALTEVYHQFICDITAKAPNQSGAGSPSYLALDAKARRLVTEDTYKDRNLAAYFRDCQWKVATKKEWNDIFEKLWPPKGFTLTATHTQNYKQARYYLYWRAMLKRSEETTANRMRMVLKQKFDTFYFMPWAHSDRIWKSVYRANFNKSSGTDRKKACPLVAICPGKAAPVWNLS